MKEAAFFILAILLSISELKSQTNIPQLKIGDTIPEYAFLQLNTRSERSSLTTLREFKQPLIILDFWATWCTSCLNSFPSMDSLQKTFNKQIQIILLNDFGGTADSAVKIKKCIAAYQKIHPDFCLPVIYTDIKAFRQFFPMKYVPRYVWLNSSRRIIAITSTEEITGTNIRMALEGHADKMPTYYETFN